jgi:hypothetical protein
MRSGSEAVRAHRPHRPPEAIPTVGAAGAIAAHLLATTGDAFTQAIGIGLLIAAVLAAATAVIVFRFMPAREAAVAPAERESLDLQPRS